MDSQICVTLQIGFLKEHINLDSRYIDMSLIRSKAVAFLEKHFPSQQLPVSENMLLFRHNYQSHNMLQLLQTPDQIRNGTVIEIVLSSKNEKPTQPHIVGIHSYFSPTFCDYCGEILVGLTKQGLKCCKCNHNFHKRCAFAAQNNCAGYNVAEVTSPPVSNGPPSQPSNGFGLPHTFVVHTYKKPTVCKHCNNVLLGLLKQGLQCRDCKVNVHRKCSSFYPYNCYAIEPMDSLSISEPLELEPELVPVPEDVEMLPVPPGEDAGIMETGDQIPLIRIPGQGGTAPPSKTRQAPAILEGWMLHFTSSNKTKKRHYWKMDARAITLFHDENLNRVFRIIPLAEILGLKMYDGPPVDDSGPPHCIEIQTSSCIYYVGENLDWYTRANVPMKIPRRESGVGMASAKKWLETIRQAMLPPTTSSQKRKGRYPKNGATKENAEADKASALEFSAIYQIFTDDQLGNGQFGTVYAGVHRTSKRNVAIKEIIKERSMSQKWKDALRNEVSILQKLNHPGIITLEAMFEFSDKIYVVMEKMKADMLEMILSNGESRLSERITKFLVVQILKALKYLHEKNIAHCDLKPENVLLSSDDDNFPQTKLCDFGYARIIGENTFRKTVVGTPAYLAPEVLQKRGYNKSLDMWSVGVVIYVTLSGTFPFNEGEEIEDQIKNAAFMYPQHTWKDISAPAVDLITKLLKVTPEERLEIDKCLTHPWLHDPQLFQDLRALETRLNVRYLTTAEDEAYWCAATNEK